jgi:hypothetical protein
VVHFDEKQTNQPFLFRTGDTFLAMMENTALHHVPVGTVFQLDGVLPCFFHCVHAFLDTELPESLYNKRTHYLPLHCPDLTPLDFSRGLKKTLFTMKRAKYE